MLADSFEADTVCLMKICRKEPPKHLKAVTSLQVILTTSP